MENKDVTIEEMKALYFDSDALIEPNYKLYQLNSNKGRYYYRYDDDGEPEFYPSVTTILGSTLPKSPWLINWIAQKGVEEAERYKMERASYGTFMHAQFEKLLIERRYDLDMLKSELKSYIERKELPSDFIYYEEELKKDILAFAQFISDYDVKPWAVEISLVHQELRYAGMIDLVCTMKKSPKSEDTQLAIIDFKSGRNGFSEEAEIQLHMYRELFANNFGVTIEKVYNFAPKDWRKSPTYTLKDQSDSPNQEKIPYLLGLAMTDAKKGLPTFVDTYGVIDLDNIDLTKNVESLTMSELVKAKHILPDKVEKPQKTTQKRSKKASKATEPKTKKTRSNRKNDKNNEK